MKKDLFAYLNATVNFVEQIVDANNQPILLENYNVFFKTAKEFATPELESYTLGDGISIVDANNSIISIEFNPSVDKGYTARQFVYQLSLVETSSNNMSVYMGGRLFIDPTIQSEDE